MGDACRAMEVGTGVLARPPPHLESIARSSWASRLLAKHRVIKRNHIMFDEQVPDLIVVFK
jgi:hypothetical protein